MNIESITQLSRFLLAVCFFSALGTTESIEDGTRRIVTKGEVNCYDSENGVFVVYDETGSPWIKRNVEVTAQIQAALRKFNLQSGGYVPHSNDGGHFVSTVIPKLLAGDAEVQA